MIDFEIWIGNQNLCPLRCLSKRGMVNYDRGEIHDKHCSEPEQDFLVSAVLNFCTLFLFCFWIERPLQTALRAMKVNELHQIEDVNYKQISTVFRLVQCSAVQFWIDPQNLKCVSWIKVDCDTKSRLRIRTENVSYYLLNKPIFPNKKKLNLCMLTPSTYSGMVVSWNIFYN